MQPLHQHRLLSTIFASDFSLELLNARRDANYLTSATEALTSYQCPFLWGTLFRSPTNGEKGKKENQVRPGKDHWHWDLASSATIITTTRQSKDHRHSAPLKYLPRLIQSMVSSSLSSRRTPLSFERYPGSARELRIGKVHRLASQQHLFLVFEV